MQDSQEKEEEEFYIHIIKNKKIIFDVKIILIYHVFATI